MKDIVDKLSWDMPHVLNCIQHLCDTNDLNGKLHTDSTSNAINSIFIPFVYEQNQIKLIGDMFNAKGYVTFEQANQAGISTKRLKTWVLDARTHAIAFQQCLINPDTIIAPLQIIVEEIAETETFVDLSLHLPRDIFKCRDDVRSIMNEHILNKLNLKGCLVLDDHEAIYFSPTMIDNISNRILAPLIEDFAKTRALEMADEIELMKKETNKSKKSQPKVKSKMPKKKSQENDIGISLPNPGMLPIAILVTKITKAYPDLCDIQSTYDNDTSYEKVWHNSDEQEGYEGPVYAFCRYALNKDSIIDQLCYDAVEAELEKIMASRQGSSLTERGHGAAKVRSIEARFEENFPSACYFLQLTSKITTLDQTSDETKTSQFENDMLHLCACFARKITEYCLFKTGLHSDGLFYFSKDLACIDEGYFYSHVDLTDRHFPSIYLTCTSAPSGDWRDPLKLLREIMPGGIGVDLARMWILTGDNHYDRGVLTGDSSMITRPGNLSKFFTHVEQSCL